MSTLILGAGALGIALGKRLLEEKQSIALIDNDPNIIRDISNVLDCPVLLNEGNIVEALAKTNPKSYTHFVAATSVDEINLLACQLITGMHPDIVTTARIRSEAYSQLIGQEKTLLGVDYLVYSQQAVADAIISRIRSGGVGNAMYFGSSHFQLRSILIEKNNPLLGQTLSVVAKTFEKNFLVPLAIRENQYLIPHGNYVFTENDIVYFLGDEEDITPFVDNSNDKKQKNVKRIVIVGGSAVGQSIAATFYRHKPQSFVDKLKFLSHKNAEIVIVEESRDLCKTLAKKFPKALIINAKIGESETFSKTVLQTYDLFFSCLANQEKNILLAAEAKVLGVKYALAIAGSYEYSHLLPKLGIDGVLSQRESEINAILKIILGGAVQRVHSLLGGEVEIVELSVSPESKVYQQKIQDVDWPQDSLALFIQHEDNYLLPTGDYQLDAGDIVGFMALSGASLAKIRGLFDV